MGRELKPDPRPPRAMLYNEHGSKIFDGEEAIQAAIDDGWSDEPVELAQASVPDGDTDLASEVQRLNAALAKQHDEIAAAKKDASDAKAEATKANNRADAAEADNKKLTAALKKAQSSSASK